MKHCLSCQELKSVEMFHVDRSAEDGRSKRCKDCVNKAAREKRAYENRNRPADWKKKTQDKAAYMKAWSAARPGYATAKKAAWYAKNKDRLRVREKVKYALKAGKLVKTPCQVCGGLDVEGHHPDYSAPLSIVWLCKSHHRQLHREAR